QGEPVQARYIRLRRLDSERTNWAAIRSFVVTPDGGASLEYGGSGAASDGVLRAFDRQPGTSFKNTGEVSFEVPAGKTSYTFLLSLPESGSVRVCQYDKRNKLRAEMTSSEPFFTIDVAKKVTRIALIGKAEVFEIIPK
ncbi:MAG: beta-N-acetylglucosaminidase, partial [Prevotella fusca]